MKLKEGVVWAFFWIIGISLTLLSFSTGLAYIKSTDIKSPQQVSSEKKVNLIEERRINNTPPIIKEGLKLKKLAIILDDSGYVMDDNVKTLLNLKIPLTFSIIPGLKYSKLLAETAHNLGHEVIIHMPMETNRDTMSSFKYKIRTNMSEEEITKNIEAALSSVPYAVGMNNHAGSKVTKDKETMKNLIKELNRLNLYFVDSLTTSNSVGYKIAKEYNGISLARDIFLDNENDINHVKEQLKKAVRIAQLRGYAIAQGHVTKNSTIVALKELEDYIKRRVEVIPVSELLKSSELLNNSKGPSKNPEE